MQSPIDASVEAAWEAEILLRLKEVDSGEVVPETLEEARHKLASALK
jgi:hypothetical protein